MKIAIVSDTHGNVANFKKVASWLNGQNIKVILHAGDIGSPESLRESLEEFDGEFFGVFGNMDKDYKIYPVKSAPQNGAVSSETGQFNQGEIDEYNKIPNVKVEENVLEIRLDNRAKPLTNSHELVSGKKVAITHFPGEAKELAQSGKYDLVFYGHTHRPCLARHSGVPFGSEGGGRKECLLINPGELAGQFYKPTFATYDTKTGNLELKILEKL